MYLRYNQSFIRLAPDKALIDDIENFIMSYDKPLGIHDLMMHDYGPGRMFMTLHVEVDCQEDVMKIHEEIDDIERAIQEKYHIHTTIHYDPVDVHNPRLLALKQQVLEIVKGIDEHYSIHDFRMVPGKNHTNLIFDVLIPANDQISHQILKNKIVLKSNKSVTNIIASLKLIVLLFKEEKSFFIYCDTCIYIIK